MMPMLTAQSGGQPELVGRLRRERAHACPEWSNVAPHLVLGEQIGQADLTKKLLVPPTVSPFVPQVSPFADVGTQAAGINSSGAIDQIIGQVEELARLFPGRGQVRFEPFEFRRLHLGREPAADVAQHVMAVGIDLRRFGQHTMIHPDDHVAPRIAFGIDGQRLVRAVEHHQRARGIEPDADHGRSLDSGLATTGPDYLDHSHQMSSDDCSA